ncbi:MAG TPA: FAD:protein FMN transferase [Chloroflexia bacterium]|nr:FAD:protein FMN transferase [Chloroflexia bacterium]
MRKIEFRAMGSQILAAVDSGTDPAAERVAALPALFESWEQTLSRFRPDSELSRLNSHTAGRPFRANRVLWEVLTEAFEAVRFSGGLVTPTMLDALERAGYDRTFEALSSSSSGRAATALAEHTPRSSEGRRAIRLNASTRSVTLPLGVRLDLGGIAKGWAVDTAAACLAECGPALVDAGGDIAVSGPMADGSPWPVGVTDPVTGGELDRMALSHGGIATSGRDYRRWLQDGTPRHHIIDPRTSRPAETDVLSVTVVAPNARQAEVAAKAALILGSRGGLDWIEARPPLAALVVLESGRAIRSTRWREHTWR